MSPNTMIQLLSVNRALARDVHINGRRVRSAIGKQPVAGAVAVRPMGIAGDEQADLSVHGGLSKAVYAYPSEHFPFWRTVRAQAQVGLWDEAVPPGLMGENLTLAGVTEDQLWIGDQLLIGGNAEVPGCVLAVSEPRFPCFKFNAAMGFKHASKMMVQSGYCGAYLGVILPGPVCAGDSVRLQPGPREVNLRDLFKSRARD
jgi:MOSC domain-containing protein YiiM